jgi:hypothetical protein
MVRQDAQLPRRALFADGQQRRRIGEPAGAQNLEMEMRPARNSRAPKACDDFALADALPSLDYNGQGGEPVSAAASNIQLRLLDEEIGLGLALREESLHPARRRPPAAPLFASGAAIFGGLLSARMLGLALPRLLKAE